MPHTDVELISRLIDSTRSGKLGWQRTAGQDEYATAFGGKWTVVIVRSGPPFRSNYFYSLRLQDAEGQELLRITSEAEDRLSELFELARRNALNIDAAIEEIISELDDDIPQRR